MEYYEFKKEDAYEFARVSGIQSKQRGDELQLLFCPYCRGGKNGDKGTFSISLVTGQFKCLRSSCSASGNIVTLARDFDYFSLGKDIDAYYRTGKQKRFRQFKKMEPIKPKPEAVTYLESRKITAATAEKYHITVQSKHENILVFPFLDEMRKRFRGTVKAVQQQDYRGCKDANELLCKYGKDAVRRAVEQAKIVLIDRVIEIADIKAVDLFSLPKISTGIKGIDKVLSGGIYLGQTVILTGKRGDGKSTLGSQILANALNDGKAVFAYSGELPDYFFKRWLDFQIAGQHNVIDRAGEAGFVNYFIPDSKVYEISEWYRGRAYLFDNQSTEDSELDYLLIAIEKTIQQYGIQLVLLDNLMTALDIGLDIDLYRAQSKFVDKLVKIAKNYNIAVILVVHPRKNSLGADDNDVVSGSSDITNKVDVVMTYKRDKSLPDNERLLIISKNRLTGRLALGEKAIKLYYDEASKRISDNCEEFRKPYGWETDQDGFVPVDSIKQMEIPFCD